MYLKEKLYYASTVTVGLTIYGSNENETFHFNVEKFKHKRNKKITLGFFLIIEPL